MKIILIIILFTIIIYSIINAEIFAATYQDDYDALNKINVTDGINQTEAYIIAKAFFWSKISGCGFPDKPIKVKETWVSKTRIGYVGKQGASIIIDNKSGTVTWANKIVTLEEIRKSNLTSGSRLTPQTRAFFAKGAKKSPVCYAT